MEDWLLGKIQEVSSTLDLGQLAKWKEKARARIRAHNNREEGEPPEPCIDEYREWDHSLDARIKLLRDTEATQLQERVGGLQDVDSSSSGAQEFANELVKALRQYYVRGGRSCLPISECQDHRGPSFANDIANILADMQKTCTNAAVRTNRRLRIATRWKSPGG